MFRATFAKPRFQPLFALSCSGALLVAIGGCKMPSSTTNYAASTTNPFETTTAPEPVVRQAAATEPTSEPAQEADLSAVLDQLQEIDDINPQARAKLTEDLRNVKPELWPLMIQQFKSALAYRQQVAESEQQTAEAVAAVDIQPKPQEATPVVATPVAYNPPSPPEAAPTPPPTAVAVHVNEPQDSEPVVVSDSQPPVEPIKQLAHYDLSQTLPSPPHANITPAIAQIETAAMQQVVQASAATTHTNWNDDIQQATNKLHAEVSPQPASTEELHEHVKLRMLQLMSGQRGQAMTPIPGASPALQDYWSKQLFAISTHLDHDQQPDEKRRAAASLYHLDQARAKLAELATLQIRNLSIVESVNGYGNYTPRETLEFKPGDPVSLYAEVENLQSESTADGYHSSVSTSYEVIDISGQRVDGRQFPDVKDLCRTPRRDFHMQYGVNLPTRIYPGEYQLRLTVTDQLSHKIGQASVAFVIVE